jgi:hypothetical protein
VKNLDSPKEKVIKCFHCGNETLMRQTGEYSWRSRDDFDFQYKYRMYACPVCNKVTLLQVYSDETMITNEMTWAEEETILFPLNSIESNFLPKAIKESYEAALKVRNVDATACALLLRRALEVIMTDQGATAWGLADKIEEIANKGLLPDSLKEASFFTKKFGDSAAHGSELIDNRDINPLIEFIEYIIEYLYIIPSKIEELKAKLECQED